MAGETFYTYLHGPRTFCGNSGSNIRINNNFGFPCTPPMMWGCGCNHGSGNSIWPAMMMFNSMMAQTIPYWNFGKSEGAGASDTAGTTAYLDKLTTARQTLDQIGFTKAEGYGLYLDENNNIVYRYNKDGKEYTASSMAELTAKISTGATEGAGSSEDTSDNAATVTLRDSIASGTSQTDESDAAEETTSTDSTDATDSADSTASSGNTHSTSGARRAFKRGNLNNGWEWTTYSKLPNGDLKTKISKADCKTAVDILKAIYPNWADKSDAEIKDSASYKLLMDANPGAIDNDGKIVNKNKLDLFVRKTAEKKVNGRDKAHKISAANGYSLERTESGSYIYQHNGKNVTAEEYAKACPQTFINEHNKRWTDETVLAALNAFDSIKLSKYPNSGKGCFKSVIAMSSSNSVAIRAKYKGNGVFNNWQYTMTYTGLKNGIIGLDINKIYEDVVQGYNRIGD